MKINNDVDANDEVRMLHLRTVCVLQEGTETEKCSGRVPRFQSRFIKCPCPRLLPLPNTSSVLNIAGARLDMNPRLPNKELLKIVDAPNEIGNLPIEA